MSDEKFVNNLVAKSLLMLINHLTKKLLINIKPLVCNTIYNKQRNFDEQY